MNQLATVDLETGEIRRYKPQEALEAQAKDDAVIELARRTKNWPLLEKAVEKKLDDQQDFINWWRDNVQRPGGDRQSEKHSRGSALMVDSAEALTGISHQQVAKWAKRLQKRDVYRTSLYGAAYKKAMGELAAASELVLQSLSNEHYTPAKYVEAARSVLGAIDLDPATSEEAQKIVKAAEYFAPPRRNGLEGPWHGRVWLNPPYGGLAQQFVAKLMEEIAEGRVTAAIVLVNAHCTDTGWFQPLWDGLVCFTDHRIDFYGDDSRSGSTHGSMFAYFGPEPGVFAMEFAQFGPVLRRV